MLSLVRASFPKLRLIEKRHSPFMITLGWAIRPLNADFMTRYTTVVGATVYLPQAVESIERDQLAATLAHELVHQLDQRSAPLWFYLTYLLFPLPVGRSWRAHWERRGYAVDLMLAHEVSSQALERRAEWIVDLFAGPSYGWMWAGKRSARAFLAEVVAEVRAGTVQTQQPYASILAAWRGGQG